MHCVAARPAPSSWRCRSRSRSRSPSIRSTSSQQRLDKIGASAGLDVPNTFVVLVRADRQGLQRRGRDARRRAVAAQPAGRHRRHDDQRRAACRAAARPTSYYTEPGEKGQKSRRQLLHGRRARPRRRSASSSSKAATSTPSVVTKHDRNSLGVRAGGHPDARRGEGTVQGEARARQDRLRQSRAGPRGSSASIDVMLGSWPSWDKLDHIALHPGDCGRAQARLSRACPARPARRAHDSCRGASECAGQRPDHHEGALRSRTIAAGSYADDRAMAVYLTRRDRAAARHLGARHLRARRVQRQHADETDRHAAGRWRAARSTSSGTSWSRTG